MSLISEVFTAASLTRVRAAGAGGRVDVSHFPNLTQTPRWSPAFRQTELSASSAVSQLTPPDGGTPATLRVRSKSTISRHRGDFAVPTAALIVAGAQERRQVDGHRGRIGASGFPRWTGARKVGMLRTSVRFSTHNASLREVALMKPLFRVTPFLFAVAAVTCLTGADWRQFRGNDVAGVAIHDEVPATWSAAENVAWKAELLGRGLSGPIVVDCRVYLTASSGFTQNRLHVLCFDQKSGAKLWERQFWATGRTMTHPKMCVATPTPASDGQRIFAFYSSNDLICLDLDGNLQWLRGLTHDFPNASNSLWMSSSPIVAGDALIVQVENDAESFATGIDVTTGKSFWKKTRPKRANWTSPTVLTDANGRTVALLQSSAGIEAVDPVTGETAWEFTSGASTIPSSAVSNGAVFVPSNGLTVLRPGADKTPEVVWKDNRMTPGTASPVIVSDKVFVVNNAGVLQAIGETTGSMLWRLRLKGKFSATPVAAGKHLILFNEDGLGQVVDITAEEGEIVGENDLGETILGTPAISDNALFVRSDKHLWKIAK